MEYWLWSFVPWLASILLDVAMEDDVVQDPAHVVFIIVKIPTIPSLWLFCIFLCQVCFGCGSM